MPKLWTSSLRFFNPNCTALRTATCGANGKAIACRPQRWSMERMRLVDYKRMQWQDRAHFFAVSSQLMRRILVENARRHNLKRGGGVQHISLDETAVVCPEKDADLVALDAAMNHLAEMDPRKVKVVEMRFFGGLSVEETAEVLKVSEVTVKRDWRAAKLWLYRELGGGGADGPGSLEAD